MALHNLSSLQHTAGPFEWATRSTEHYPGYTSTMNRSDCHAAILPPYLFSLLEASFENDVALPSSVVNRWMTRYGLRPRHAATHSPISYAAIPASGWRNPWPIAIIKFRGLMPSLSLWLIIRLSLSFAYLVTSIRIKFCSGPVANLWPDWIVQLIHNSLPWHTLHFVSTSKYFCIKSKKTPAFLSKYSTF